MRVARQAAARQAHLVQQVFYARQAVCCANVRLQSGYAFLQKFAHAHARVERGKRVLKNDLYGAAGLHQARALQAVQGHAVQMRLAGDAGRATQ